MENSTSGVVGGARCEMWERCIDKAKERFKIADHMAYVSLSILKENRLMIKIVSELAESAKNLIKAFLYYEYSFKRVKLYHDPQLNLKTFIGKIAPKYITKEELNSIIKILKIEKQHKVAPVEFVRKEKFVILLGDRYETLTVEIVREFLNFMRISLAKFPKSAENKQHI